MSVQGVLVQGGSVLMRWGKTNNTCPLLSTLTQRRLRRLGLCSGKHSLIELMLLLFRRTFF